MTTYYVQRAKYGPTHPMAHETFDKTHISLDGDKTVCGKTLNEMWFFVKEQKITCKFCKKLIG